MVDTIDLGSIDSIIVQVQILQAVVFYLIFMKKYRILRRQRQGSYLPIAKNIFGKQGEVCIKTTKNLLLKETVIANFIGHLRKKLDKKGYVAFGHPINQILTSKALGSRIGKGKGPVVGKASVISKKVVVFSVYCDSIEVKSLKNLVKREARKKLGSRVCLKLLSWGNGRVG